MRGGDADNASTLHWPVARVPPAEVQRTNSGERRLRAHGLDVAQIFIGLYMMSVPNGNLWDICCACPGLQAMALTVPSVSCLGSKSRNLSS